MTSREKVMAVFERRSNGEGVMWTGNPKEETIPIFAKAYGVEPNCEAIYTYLNDDCRWIGLDQFYHHPEGQDMYDITWRMKEFESMSLPEAFATVETIKDLDKFPWPDAKYIDYEAAYKALEEHPDKMIFTGIWAQFFHVATAFFGMENYFIKMYDEPEIVEAMTERIVDFYAEANDKFLSGIGDRADVVFFGNDLGTQLDLFMSPELFRKFILPSLKRLIDITKKYNKKVMMHSCGAISRIIPDLIDAGIDILHPIQAQAAGMSADNLKQYKNDLAFVGGIDAQSFFVNATPEEIRQEVKRVKSILGPNIVISPSHEAILPNVPPENILAMARSAKED